jgi:hypothetical protein
MELLAATMVLALLVLNIVATMRIVRCDDFEPSQRVMQFMIVWLLPLIGALVVLYHSRVREPQSGIAKAGDDIYQGQIIRPREVDAPADD